MLRSFFENIDFFFAALIIPLIACGFMTFCRHKRGVGFSAGCDAMLVMSIFDIGVAINHRYVNEFVNPAIRGHEVGWFVVFGFLGLVLAVCFLDVEKQLAIRKLLRSISTKPGLREIFTRVESHLKCPKRVTTLFGVIFGWTFFVFIVMVNILFFLPFD